MKSWLYNLAYRWIDRRGRIPQLAYRFWPCAHWCPEMDFMLILANTMDCFCGTCAEENAAYRDEFAKALSDKDVDDLLF